MTTDPDPITPAEEALRDLNEHADQMEADNIELLGELDAMRAELEAARRELDAMRNNRDEWRRLAFDLDAAHQPSPPRDRPRFAGEDHDDYALRGQ